MDVRSETQSHYCRGSLCQRTVWVKYLTQHTQWQRISLETQENDHTSKSVFAVGSLAFMLIKLVVSVEVAVVSLILSLLNDLGEYISEV